MRILLVNRENDMMNWDQLLSVKRFGLESRAADEFARLKTQFQRDFDRLIFSSPFRRLQDKRHKVLPCPEAFLSITD